MIQILVMCEKCASSKEYKLNHLSYLFSVLEEIALNLCF